MTGLQLILAERERQKTVEGWTPSHDDEHHQGQMASAAECYAAPPEARRLTQAGVRVKHPTGATVYQIFDIPKAWPWGAEWWKPCPNDRARELVKAGALFMAEIDRLGRRGGRDELLERRVIEMAVLIDGLANAAVSRCGENVATTPNQSPNL